MLYPTTEKWSKWAISEDFHQLFCLHWTEILDSETSDTWQARSCNVKTVLVELIDAARTAQRIESHRPMIRALLDEIFEMIHRDEILKKYYPFVAAYLRPWQSWKQDERRSVYDIERLAIVILGNLNDYWAKGVELITQLLNENVGKGKSQLYNATMNLAVETILRGRSAQHTRNLFKKEVLTENGTPFLDRLSNYFLKLAPLESEYQCFFVPEGIRRKDAEFLPEDIQFQIRESECDSLDSPNPASDVRLKRNIYLIVTVRAADPVIARYKAEDRLGEVYGGLKLFSVDDKFGFQLGKVLVTDADGAGTVVDKVRLGSHYLGGYHSWQLKIDLLFRVQQQLKKVSPTDASQLSAAIEYHHLALQAATDEARFVNLWIALEALCQGAEGSVIERICSRIAPGVAVDNIHKTMVSLSIYVRNLWGATDREDFLALFPNSTADRLKPEDLLSVLLLDNDDPRIEKLLQLCSKHPLIMHRLYRIKTKTLAKPEMIRDNILFTHRNIDWQIKRIYRVRNAIVHTGSANTSLPQITQHLHCYLVKTIHSILIDLERHPDWTIKDSLEHRRQLFDHVVTLFDTKTPGKISQKALLDPEVCLQPQVPPFAWTPPESKECKSSVTTT